MFHGRSVLYRLTRHLEVLVRCGIAADDYRPVFAAEEALLLDQYILRGYQHVGIAVLGQCSLYGGIDDGGYALDGSSCD